LLNNYLIMKTIFKTFLIAFTVMLFSTNVSAQEKKIQTATIKTTIYCDHCKVCETCGQLFNQKLLKEPGVQMVVLDEEKMTIKVTYNTKKTDLGKVKTAISKLGYDADDVKADPAGYKNLDGCCKK
jgi:mercuric ion binding protein